MVHSSLVGAEAWSTFHPVLRHLRNYTGQSRGPEWRAIVRRMMTG